MLLWVSIVAAGMSLGCVFLMIFSPWATDHSFSAPDSFRQRCGIFWPWVAAFSAICRPFITWGMRQRLSHRAEMAGLTDDCKPEHLVALCGTGAIFGCLASVAGLLYFDFAEGVSAVMVTLCAGALLAGLPLSRLRRMGRERQLDMLRSFPFLLDMTTLCVEAGLNLQGALIQAVVHGPTGSLHQELSRALSDMRAGVHRMTALKRFAARTGLPEVSQWVMAMEQADQLGMSLGPILRAQSEQRRNERFLRAEKLALEAPVKMLFPMVTCIFPCTFLVIAFPIAIKLLAVDF